MVENKKNCPEPAENTPLTDERLSEVSGGEATMLIAHPVGFKYCAADPSHVYVDTLEACPVCGSKEFTYGR